MTRINYDNKKTPIFSNLVDDFFGLDSRLASTSFFKSNPAVNIKETEGSFFIELAAPGLEKEDFNISIEENHLVVSSEKEISNNIEKERFTKKEFSYAKFKRTFTLPENIEKELIEASYRSGILSLELPKRKEELKITKQIQVK